MGRSTEQVRQQAVAAYVKGGKSAASVAKRYGTTVRTLQRWVACYRFAQGELHPAQEEGRTYNAEERELLRDYAQAHPQATHEHLRQFMAQRTGKTVHISTLRALLGLLGLSGFRTEIPPPRTDTTPARTPRKPRRHDKKPRAARAPAPAPQGAAKAPPQPTRYTQAHRPEPIDGYPSDLTDTEWQELQPHFVSQGGRPPEHEPRLMLNAIFYVLRSGCAWRMLPHDFPPWKSVYTAFRRWSQDGRLQKAHDALRRKLRVRLGRKEDPTALVVDSQSVKTTEKGGPKATMAARRSPEESATSP